MDTKLSIELTKYFLRKRGLAYFGSDDTIEAEVEKHHPSIAQQVTEVLGVIHAVTA